jgi:hypothetical protein
MGDKMKMAKNGKTGDMVKINNEIKETISFIYTTETETEITTYEGSKVIFANSDRVIKTL